MRLVQVINPRLIFAFLLNLKVGQGGRQSGTVESALTVTWLNRQSA